MRRTLTPALAHAAAYAVEGPLFTAGDINHDAALGDPGGVCSSMQLDDCPYQTGSCGAYALHVRVLSSGAEWVSPAEGTIYSPAFTNDSAHVTWATGNPDGYLALCSVMVGATAGTSPTQYGTSGLLNWDVTSAGGGWVAALFADPDPGAAELRKSTLVVWPMGSATGTTITTFAEPWVVAFSPDAQYLAFGSWTQAQGGQLAAIAQRSGRTWETRLEAISPGLKFFPFTAEWGSGDWLLVQGGPYAGAVYLFKADGSDVGQLAPPGPAYVLPGGASAIYGTGAGLWRVTF